MIKKISRILFGTALCVSLAAVPMSANAATPEEAAELARSMGLPESLIQAGWNKYYENPELYPPELIDSYMATLRGMNQEMIDQLLTDNGFTSSAPSVTPEPAVTTAAPQQSQEKVTTTASITDSNSPENSGTADSGNNDNSSSGNNQDGGNQSGGQSKDDKITLTLPDGSTFDRISSKDFAAMSLDEKRSYIAGLTPEQKDAFLSNMSPEDYKSLLKQLPIDNKADIIEDMADITSQLGLTLSVDGLTDDNLVLSMKDEDGKLVALSAASDTVAATGYDRRGILALAAALAVVGIGGTTVAVKKSFGKKEV
ncbi:MAG: hypothetical protein IKK66_02895 [Ruminococcus sp.]|nr:hypothetical protein [Ruminococcus sp.]